MAVSTLVATVTTVFPVAGGSNDTHTWSSSPSFTVAKMEGSNVAKSVNHKIKYSLGIKIIIYGMAYLSPDTEWLCFFYLIQQHD